MVFCKLSLWKKLVILTGAGISEESGIRTFRDSGGLWENHNIYEVATPEAWDRDPELVLSFYNARRKQVIAAEPNVAHRALASLEKHFQVTIITQNIDDLHERAGSTAVLHLHGEIRMARSTADPERMYEVAGMDLNWGDLCELGSQLRPHVVWFGEAVPAIADAIPIVREADRFAVIGTSLNVYPAAGLVNEVGPQVPIYLIDPHPVALPPHIKATVIADKATKGVQQLSSMLLGDVS